MRLDVIRSRAEATALGAACDVIRQNVWITAGYPSVLCLVVMRHMAILGSSGLRMCEHKSALVSDRYDSNISRLTRDPRGLYSAPR